MAYSNLPIGTANPGCIIVLVDQSDSMGTHFQNGTKAARASLAVNQIIHGLVLACRSGTKIRDRCRICVIGYQGEFNGPPIIDPIVDGMVSEVADLAKMRRFKDHMLDGTGKRVEVDIEMPIWLDAKANGWTPMHSAFDRASEVVQQWVSKHPDGFPPVIINITDGAPNFIEPAQKAAEQLTALHTTDGNVLLFNIHVSDNQKEIILPHSRDQVAGDRTAELLFDISSLLPETFFETAKNDYGLAPQVGARCLVYHAAETLMVKLLEFGSLGVIGDLHLTSVPSSFKLKVCS